MVITIVITFSLRQEDRVLIQVLSHGDSSLASAFEWRVRHSILMCPTADLRALARGGSLQR